MNQNNVQSQKTFYDHRWGEFQYLNSLKLSRCVSILDRLRQTKLVQPNIIDLGCGTGWLAGILGNFGPTVGVDLSEVAIRQAQDRYPLVNFLQKDIMEWDYPRSSFDVVVSQEVIEHLEDQTGYLDIAYGLLRDHGYLILTTPNKRTFSAMPKDQMLTWSNQPIENKLTMSELKRMLLKNFTVLVLTAIIPRYGQKGIYRLVNAHRLTALSKKFGLEHQLDAIRLHFGFGLHTVVLARKKI